MRVRYKSISAGVGGCIHPGEVREVSDAYAQTLITGGYAEAVDPVELTKEPAPVPVTSVAAVHKASPKPAPKKRK